jgi:hypothetical protein
MEESEKTLDLLQYEVFNLLLSCVNILGSAVRIEKDFKVRTDIMGIRGKLTVLALKIHKTRPIMDDKGYPDV